MITYIPWINSNENPWKYIGSTSRDFNLYFGSVNHKQYKDFWKQEVKNNPSNFKKEILFVYLGDSNKELLEIENKIQHDYDAVRSKEFFNRVYANYNGSHGLAMSGSANPMFGVKRSEKWKLEQSFRMKEVGSRKETKQLRSKAQKRIQNTDHMKKLKSILKRTEYLKLKANEGFKSTQFKPTRVLLKDVSFLSKNEFDKWLSQNNLMKTYNKSLELMSINDLFIYTQLHQTKMFTQFDPFQLESIIKRFDQLNGVYGKWSVLAKEFNVSFHNIQNNIRKVINNIDYFYRTLCLLEENGVKNVANY